MQADSRVGSTMSGLDTLCSQTLIRVDQALACAVIDMNSATVISQGITTPYISQTFLDAFADATIDMFRGRSVSVIEKLMTSQRGRRVQGAIQEIQFATEHTYHFMAPIAAGPDNVFLLVTRRNVNPCAVWATLRPALRAAR